MTAVNQDPHTIAQSYLAIWNEPDQERRLASLQAEWAPDVRYADPLMSGETPAGIATMIEAARRQFPGHIFLLKGTPDGHAGAVRFSWDLVAEAGNRVGGGTDVVKFNEDGKLEEIIGFLD